MKTCINDFRFERNGHGSYRVTYKSPATGKEFTAIINDINIIDATRNADEPKRKDLDELKRICKAPYKTW